MGPPPHNRGVRGHAAFEQPPSWYPRWETLRAGASEHRRAEGAGREVTGSDLVHTPVASASARAP